MRKILLLLTFIFFAIIFLSIDQRPVFSAHNTNDICLGIYGTFAATNWPGGRITASCEGTPLSQNPNRSCPGNSASLMPGQSFDFGSCSCPPFADGCLTISDLPPGCTSNPASGAVCGTNSQSINRNIQVTCPAPTPTPTRTPAPTPRPKSSPCPPLGDVDGDGQITQNDADEIGRHNAGLSPTLRYIETNADVDGNRVVNSVDSTNILQYLANLGSTFACPTSIPNACNVTCTRDADCQADIYSNSNTCTSCVGGTCQVPPACNASCVRDSDCNTGPALRDGCVSCVNNTCQVPLTPIPTNTPTPTPTNIPPPTVTPTPAFNPDSCKCDGIEYTTLFSGQSTTITSYGKVEGADVSRAQIASQEFFFVEGAETIGRIINKSSAIPATVFSSTPTKVRYKSDWKFTIPQLKTGATYKIWSKVNCQPKTTAFNTQPAQTTSVLATETQNLSLLDRIFEFFNGLFGGGGSTVPALAPTITPFTSADTTTSDVLTPTVRKQLQLEPIYPLEVYQKTCSFIKFRNQLN